MSPSSSPGPSRGFRVPPLARLAANGIAVSRTVHGAGAVHPPHAHDDAYFDLVTEGAHVEEFAGGRLDLGRYSLAFRPAGFRHGNRVSAAGARCLNLELGRHWLRRHGVEDLLPPGPVQLAGGVLHQAMRRVEAELDLADAFSPLALEGLALELVARASRSRSRPRDQAPRWLARVDEMLAVPGDAPSLAALAREVGIHPSHLARTVRRHFGCSVGERVRAARLRLAVERIRGTDTPLALVAAECGFYDQAHLTRVMRRTMGLTPGRLRREIPRTARPKGRGTSKTA